MKSFSPSISVLLLCGFIAAKALADPSDIPLSVEENAKLNRMTKDRFDVQIRERLKDVDSIVVHYLPPADGIPNTATLSDPSAISDLVAHLSAKLPKDQWFKGRIEGEAVKDSVNCQCFGDFEFSFYRKNEFVGELSVHHWKHIRSKSLTEGTDTDLEEESIDRLYALAARLLPAFELKKPSQPTPPSRRG